MAYARVSLHRFSPGAADEVTHRAEVYLLPQFRQLPGFLSYFVVKTSSESGVAVSLWENASQAENAVATAAGWAKTHLAGLVIAAENHVGEVVLAEPRLG